MCSWKHKHYMPTMQNILISERAQFGPIFLSHIFSLTLHKAASAW